MKYHIVEENGFVLIKISGETRKNEAVLVKKSLLPYLQKRGIRLIVNLNELEKVEPAILIGVLTGIRKEIGFLRGDLKLCALNPDILNFFKQNRLNQIFQIYEDEEITKKSEWRDYGKR